MRMTVMAGSIGDIIVSFEILLGIVSNKSPGTYWDITGKENGRKERQPRRIMPRKRKTVLGMRWAWAFVLPPRAGFCQ
jgi:hypothetical protein